MPKNLCQRYYPPKDNSDNSVKRFIRSSCIYNKDDDYNEGNKLHCVWSMVVLHSVIIFTGNLIFWYKKPKSYLLAYNTIQRPHPFLSRIVSVIEYTPHLWKYHHLNYKKKTLQWSLTLFSYSNWLMYNDKYYLIYIMYMHSFVNWNIQLTTASREYCLIL